MNTPRALLPILALGLGGFLLLQSQPANAYSLATHNLDLGQRDFRVFNNFQDATANDNQTPDPNFPGHQGAVMAIWKASVEWSSTLHASGHGDPHQPGGLGSGGANFDVSMQGEATSPGGVSDNTHSAIPMAGGIIAFTEASSGGWRIRYNESFAWEDGPGTNPGGAIDLQTIATHEYGHALGLGHSTVSGATMSATAVPGVGARSIEADDSAGVQAIYGALAASKPLISGVIVSGSQVQILGSNFSVTGNEVWFTQATAGGNGTPIKLLGVVSTGNNITVPIPAGAGPGDVLVRAQGTTGASLSNPWPIDLPVGCLAPTNHCSSTPNSAGPGALISSNNAPSLSANNFQVLASGLPPGVLGLFFYGSGQQQVPLGDGFLCAGAPVHRLSVQAVDGLGNVSRLLDFSSPPFNGGSGQAFVGGVANFQFWYRDPGFGLAGFNLTDGLQVVYCQ